MPAAEQWSAEHTASLVELYDSIMAADPKAYTAQRIALALVSGEQSHPPSPFRIPAEDVGRASRRRVRDPAECVREALSPAGHSFSVYRSEGALHGRSESKKLSRSPLPRSADGQRRAQVAIIETVFEGILASLRASSTFPGSSDWEAPTVMVVRPCLCPPPPPSNRRL